MVQTDKNLDVDIVDIVGNRNALAEVTACLQERLHRWQQIEWLCGFPVMKNSGLPSLTATLYPDPNWMLMPRAAMSSYQIPAGVDDMEDSMPPVMPQIPGVFAKHFCKCLLLSIGSGHAHGSVISSYLQSLLPQSNCPHELWSVPVEQATLSSNL